MTQPCSSQYRGIVITDLDGTILNQQGEISKQDRDTLRQLGDAGYLRIAATGRNLRTAHNVMDDQFPIDYLVFSSGAGTWSWRMQSLMNSRLLSLTEVEEATRVMDHLDLDYFIHDPIPDNHHLRFHQRPQANTDFLRRLSFYQRTARPINRAEEPLSATQLLAITNRGVDLYHEVRNNLMHLKVIRATSPLDHDSLWIEVFANGVSKDAGCREVLDELGLKSNELPLMAIGNDYNDLDLLQWADQAYVVGNAPTELRQRFQTVGACGSGFSQAVSDWLRQGAL